MKLYKSISQLLFVWDSFVIPIAYSLLSIMGKFIFLIYSEVEDRFQYEHPCSMNPRCTEEMAVQSNVYSVPQRAESTIEHLNIISEGVTIILKHLCFLIVLTLFFF